jgi:hypothetical protein
MQFIIKYQPSINWVFLALLGFDNRIRYSTRQNFTADRVEQRNQITDAIL